MQEEQIIEKFQKQNLSLASLQKRAGAFFVDECILSVLFIIIYFDKFTLASSQEQMLGLINMLLWQLIILKVIYQSFFVWMYGASLGKMVFKIKIISINTAQNPDIFASFLRANIRILSEWFFYIGYIWAYFNPARQTIHDKFSKTLVINV